MGEKKINFWKIIKGIKRQSIRMQQRLIVYWCVVILTLFFVTVLLLSILGVLPGMDFKVWEMLSAQQKNTLSTMTEQTDIMMARSISLSEDITKELNQCLTANGKTFSDLNDNPQLIMDLESALYPPLEICIGCEVLQWSFCCIGCNGKYEDGICRYITHGNLPAPV